MIPSSDIWGGDMIAFVSESIRPVNIYFMQAHKLENMFYCEVKTSADMLTVYSLLNAPGGVTFSKGGGRLIETNFWQNVVFNNCVIVNK